MDKKQSVGLVITIEINGKVYAILQVRGTFNPEKMGPESWPGACQVTAHGGVETGEDTLSALMRELKEELGEIAARNITDYIAVQQVAQQQPLIEVARHDDDKKLAITFALHLPNPEFLKNVRLHAGSGGLRLITPDDVPEIHDLDSYDRHRGVINRSTIAMFCDEIKAVNAALRLQLKS